MSRWIFAALIAWAILATAAATECVRPRPGDDFFTYANWNWLERTPIPDDKPGVTIRSQMDDANDAAIADLLRKAAQSEPVRRPHTLRGKAGAFYRAYMDADRIEKLGDEPLRPAISAVAAAADRQAIARLMGRNSFGFEGSLFGLWMDVDSKHPERYAAFVGQQGLGLTTRDYYLDLSLAATRTKYQLYIETLLKLARWPEPRRSAASILAWETEIARVSWSAADQRNIDKTYNPLTLSGLQQLAPEFPWHAFLTEAGFGDRTEFIVAERSAIPEIAHLFASVDLPTLKAWMTFNILDNAAIYLSTPYRAARFAFRGGILTSQSAEPPRWKLAVRAVSGAKYTPGDRFGLFGNMGWGVGELYCSQIFTADAKQSLGQLVSEIQRAFKRRIERLEWMQPATKSEALRKLATYTVKIGCPELSRDYSRLLILADDLLGDVRRTARADWAFQRQRLDQPVDRRDWPITPQTTDAINGRLRDITFAAALLQPPIYDAYGDDAHNFGAIGSMIGHELTHGFDDQGRKIDAAGALRDWWAPEDAREFEALTARLGQQYSAMELLPGSRVNGALTMGENVSDLGGVSIALDAYHASLGGRPASIVNGLTGDQRFMIGWAETWRGKLRETALRRQLLNDYHAPYIARVNGVLRNLPDWYVAFDVKPGDTLYLDEAARVRIW